MVKHADSCCLMEAVSLGTLEYTLQWQCRLWHGVRMIDRPTQFWPPSVSCASLKMLYHLEMVHVPEVRIHSLWLWNLNPMILGSSKPSYCHNKSLYRVFIYLFDVLKRERYRNEDIQSTDLFIECPPSMSWARLNPNHSEWYAIKFSNHLLPPRKLFIVTRERNQEPEQILPSNILHKCPKQAYNARHPTHKKQPQTRVTLDSPVIFPWEEGILQHLAQDYCDP